MAAKLAWCSFVIAVALMAWGFITPPPGEVHHSVLVGIGMLLLFAAFCLFGFNSDRNRRK